MENFNTLIGTGTDLTGLQMSVRTIIIFFTALLLLRIAGLRTIGKKSALDYVIMIMLGAVLSRAIAGVSPFFPTICSALVMVLLHRLLATITQHNDWLGKLIKGEKVLLYKNGLILNDNMRRVQISEKDLLEEVRIQAQSDDLRDISEIYIERTGEISLIKA